MRLSDELPMKKAKGPAMPQHRIPTIPRISESVAWLSVGTAAAPKPADGA
jgi:hypothetical protein